MLYLKLMSKIKCALTDDISGVPVSNNDPWNKRQATQRGIPAIQGKCYICYSRHYVIFEKK